MSKPFYRFCIFNLCGAVLLVWGILSGALDVVLTAVMVHPEPAIALVVCFFLSLFSATTRMAIISNGRPDIKRMLVTNARLFDWIDRLAMIGIIGNCYGFLIAFTGFEVSDLSNLSTALVSIGTALKGGGTAFSSVFVSMTFALWARWNYTEVQIALELADLEA